jgi:hypothetical protein
MLVRHSSKQGGSCKTRCSVHSESEQVPSVNEESTGRLSDRRRLWLEAGWTRTAECPGAYSMELFSSVSPVLQGRSDIM